MSDKEVLVDRVRDALANHLSLREVKMFGGLAFMVNDKMVVSVASDGDLLVRADPKRRTELRAMLGARQAEMGTGREMGDSWTSVDSNALVADDALTYWIDVALSYNDDARKMTARRRVTTK